MENKFHENLKILAKQYTQREIALKTGFSQSSINNYLSGMSEPSMQFLVALKKAFGISIDEFLFSEIQNQSEVDYHKYIGNYIVYYYNNTSYKGEVHTNLKNTLNYGVISVLKDKATDNSVRVYATFVKGRVEATKLLKELNTKTQSVDIVNTLSQSRYFYKGNLSVSEESISIEIKDKKNGDFISILLNNPPTISDYIGGIGTVNSISRGREHNPCVQYIIISKKIIEKPDGELYNCLKLNDYNINLSDAINDIVSLFKRLYTEDNEISLELSENQKMAIIKNKLEYHFYDILEANVFRFAKVSNKEDDAVFKLIREASNDRYWLSLWRNKETV